jgi:hypothetical protein
MPSIIAEKVAQVVMGYLSGGEPCENIYHVHSSVAWTTVLLEDLLATFQAWEMDTASLLRSDEAELIRATATDLTSITSPRYDEPLETPVPGALVSPVLPSNVTLAVKADIGERGRGRNGRTFWIGLSEGQVAMNLVGSVVVTDIVSALNTLITDITTAAPDQTLGIIHTVAAGVPLTPATFSPIIGWSVTDRSIDSQRDRLPFHKAHRVGVGPLI